MISAREHVVEIVNKFYTSNSDLKSILNQYFIDNKVNTLERNRALILTKDIIRWKGRLDWYIKSNLNSPFSKLQSKLLAIMELASYELLFDEQVPNYAAINSAVELAKKKINKRASGLVNAVLRKISRYKNDEKPKEITNYEWFSFPEWLYKKWITQFGEKNTQELCDYLNSPLQLIIRRNSLKIDHENFIEKINNNKIEIAPIDNSHRFYVVVSGGSELIKSSFFREGLFTFQDRAAGAIVEVLDPQPNEIILDVCCAPGTKTNYIAELIQNNGKIYASDIEATRIKTAKDDAIRVKNSSIIWEQKDATVDTFPVADRVLIDAPCTGTGVIGRRPDIKWRRKPVHLSSVVALQKALLNNVHKFVKPGGILVYATCSLEEEENWNVVNAFLKLQDDFKVISIENPQLKLFIDEKGALNTFPPTSKMDGMFAVKMIKEL